MLKTLTRAIREYKKDTILTPLTVMLEVVVEIMIPFLMAKLIDEGLNNGDMKRTLLYGGIMIVCAILGLVFGALSGKFCATASSGFAKNLRQDLYYKVQTFSFANIDRFSTSGIITRMTTDVTNVQNAFMMIIRIAVRAPLMFVFSLIMSILINPKLSMTFVIALPIMLLALYLIFRMVHPIFERVFHTYDKLNNVVEENLHGIRVVKSFVREDHEISKFRQISQAIFSDFSFAEKILAFNAPVMQLTMYFCMLVLSWLGAKFIVAGNMTTGEFTSLITYIMSILMSLMMLSVCFVMVTLAQASAERICEVLNEKSTLHDPEEPVMTVSDGSIDFEDVSFSYSDDPEKLSLKNINIHINSGETIGLIGGTGSAKSSLVQLIPRLYDATLGVVKVGGRDVKTYHLETLRDEVAVVLQKNLLFSGTIADNLRWGDPDATEEELWRACDLACASEFIHQMPEGLNTMIEQGGTNVSGGQRQRLCIARALIKKPKVLILDDSTSAVDTATDAKIRDAFKKVIPGTTKIIIAQRIASVQDADHIIVMESGTVSAFGNHETLLKTSDIYREVYESQTKGGGDFDE